MEKFYNETCLKLGTAIKALEIETDCPIIRFEAAILGISAIVDSGFRSKLYTRRLARL